MKYDEYGHSYCSSTYLCELLYKNPDLKINQFLVEDPETYNNAVKLLHADLPTLKRYSDLFNNRDPFASIEEFDCQNQSTWFMPDSYKNIQIDEFILSQCKTDSELERVKEELLLFQERNLFNLLKFLNYLVDTMRKYNIVWGVGRGSSVASYVLYLLGVHKINSIKHELDIREFLK